MPRVETYIGRRFGRLTVIGFEGDSCRKKAVCRCDCGIETRPEWGNVRAGRTRSCGCLEKESRISHGMSGTREHNSWENMWNRCGKGNRQNSIAPQYSRVPIDPRWKRFENFFADMGARPKDTSLDRIDNSAGYKKSNCRWATRKQQQRNISSNRWLTFKGETKCLSEWSVITNIAITTILGRLDRGWPVDDALSLSPSLSRGKRS